MTNAERERVEQCRRLFAIVRGQADEHTFKAAGVATLEEAGALLLAELRNTPHGTWAEFLETPIAQALVVRTGREP